MDPSLSEESHKPIDELQKDLQALLDDNDDIEASIREKNQQIQEKRQITASLLIERNWYLQVIDRLEKACEQDERLKPIQDALHSD